MSTGCVKEIFFFLLFFGVPGESRTPNLLIRSQMLYPIKLRAQNSFIKNNSINLKKDDS